MIQDHVSFIVSCVRKRPYSWVLIASAPLYLLGIIVIYTYIYNGNPFRFYESYSVWFTVTISALNIIISVLFGLVITLFIAKLKELKLKSAGVGLIGIFFGSLAAGCPGCIFGLFPVVLSLFGVSGTLAILPLSGIEFQLLTVVLMCMSLFFLSEETDLSCRI